MKLCITHHAQICDTWPDQELDAAHIPASDSGDFQHVSEEECELCAEKPDESSREN